MDREALYNELIQSEPLGFIDPFSDLGEFDPLQLKFKQPVKELVNRIFRTTLQLGLAT